MIEIFTGVPGAGKTYLAVKTLSEKYFQYSTKDEFWSKKPDKEKYTIFTNINGLALPDVKDLTTIFEEQKLTFDQFFSKSYQDKIHEKYPNIVYVIDECQQFIPFRYSNQQTILYFDTHRHYGDHIILITQDLAKITKSISTLCEMEYRAVRSTLSIIGEFKYNMRTGGEIFKRLACKPDKKIFALYKSFEGDNQKKIVNNLKYYVLFMIFGFIFMVWFFYGKMLKPSIAKTTENKSVELLEPITAQKTEVLTDEFISKPILTWVCNSNGVLISFECPFTGRIFNANPAPYQIVSTGSYFFALARPSHVALLE